MDLTYHIRKSWEDINSQVGIDYNFLINAKKACDKLVGYYVFDSNGICVYPETLIQEVKQEAKYMFNKGDAVQLVAGATQVDGSPLKEWTFRSKLYIKDINENYITLAKTERGSSIGTVIVDNIVPYNEELLTNVNNDFIPYPAIVMSNNASIFNGPGLNYKAVKSIKKYDLFTIVNEKNGWGKLKIGAGWINLNDIKNLSE